MDINQRFVFSGGSTKKIADSSDYGGSSTVVGLSQACNSPYIPPASVSSSTEATSKVLLPDVANLLVKDKVLTLQLSRFADTLGVSYEVTPYLLLTIGSTPYDHIKWILQQWLSKNDNKTTTIGTLTRILDEQSLVNIAEQFRLTWAESALIVRNLDDSYIASQNGDDTESTTVSIRVPVEEQYRAHHQCATTGFSVQQFVRPELRGLNECAPSQNGCTTHQVVEAFPLLSVCNVPSTIPPPGDASLVPKRFRKMKTLVTLMIVTIMAVVAVGILFVFLVQCGSKDKIPVPTHADVGKTRSSCKIYYNLTTHDAIVDVCNCSTILFAMTGVVEFEEQLKRMPLNCWEGIKVIRIQGTPTTTDLLLLMDMSPFVRTITFFGEFTDVHLSSDVKQKTHGFPSVTRLEFLRLSKDVNIYELLGGSKYFPILQELVVTCPHVSMANVGNVAQIIKSSPTFRNMTCVGMECLTFLHLQDHGINLDLVTLVKMVDCGDVGG